MIFDWSKGTVCEEGDYGHTVNLEDEWYVPAGAKVIANGVDVTMDQRLRTLNTETGEATYLEWDEATNSPKIEEDDVVIKHKRFDLPVEVVKGKC